MKYSTVTTKLHEANWELAEIDKSIERLEQHARMSPHSYYVGSMVISLQKHRASTLARVRKYQRRLEDELHLSQQPLLESEA